MTSPATSFHRRFSDVRLSLTTATVVDAVVVIATATFAVARDHWDVDAKTIGFLWVFDLALALPLTWRRRQPVMVFCVVAVEALVLWIANVPAGGSVAVLAALYAVGAYDGRRTRVFFAAAIAQLGAVMATVRWAPVDHRATAFVLLTGTVTAIWVLGVYARTRRAYITSALDRAAAAERERDQRALLATAAERARISREMHDIVAHTLSVMVALSDGAAIAAERDIESARDAMEQSATLGRQALSELRRLLGGLEVDGDVDLSPTPGMGQLEDLVAAVRTSGLPVDLVMTGQPPAMPPGLQLAVYRLVQESLTNVLKHAPGATRAVVTLRYTAAGVDVQIDDDNAESVSEGPLDGSGGRGLAGMRQRAAVFGGTVEAGPRPEGGWRVNGRVNLHDLRRTS